MIRSILFICFTLLLSSLFSFATIEQPSDWGFFGHRKINRMAIFTLPPELIKFYKTNIEFVTEHAVDPDKRRYSTKFEFARHYIDIDHWGQAPFDNIPRNLQDAVIKYGAFDLIDEKGDTTKFNYLEEDQGIVISKIISELGSEYTFARGDERGKSYMKQFVKDNYYEDLPWTIEASLLLEKNIPDGSKLIFTDIFSQYGIVPYYLPIIYARLVKAFEAKNIERILQLSTDIGHYIGDAHVPLHTTENYNGQLTDQVGIHGFWESRIPELFAEEEYDFFVGSSSYIDNKSDYFWDIVLESHSLLDSVLFIEKDLSHKFPKDQQYCYDDRLGRTIRTYCEEYADTFHDRMSGMVEKRMRESILSIGSVWYSAWIDAGQPDLHTDKEYVYTDSLRQELKLQDAQYQGGTIFGRDH